LGAEKIVVVGLGEAPAKVEQIANELREMEGRNVYVIPGGASTQIGALGYCACAQEIQVRTTTILRTRIVILWVGFIIFSPPTPPFFRRFILIESRIYG
jgi:1-aminocyclopropane-1-carboxylate deaminase/D-cysteine desulfhydrase-like pyridoxal-dependent ACC family enzyme